MTTSLRDALVALANDWNRRDKQSREHGGTRIYVADCANELRDQTDALLSAHPATDSAQIGSNSVLPELPRPAIVDPGRYGIAYTADQMHAYACAALNAAWPGMVARIRELERIEAWWRPIEKTPKDGTVVMFHVPGKDLPHMSRADDFWYGRDHADDRGFAHWLDGATHWMPLPAPPAEGEK